MNDQNKYKKRNDNIFSSIAYSQCFYVSIYKAIDGLIFLTYPGFAYECINLYLKIYLNYLTESFLKNWARNSLL